MRILKALTRNFPTSAVLCVVNSQDLGAHSELLLYGAVKAADVE